MKIKLDENIPSDLVDALSALGHDVDTVPVEGLAGSDDDTVWQAAQVAGRLLVTQDLDFSDVRKFQPGRHGGIVLVRLRDPSRSALVQRILGVFQAEGAERWAHSFVVITEHKLRVRSGH
jgi:predicted nuclease of predicted toxin-antitoxin system